MIIVRPVGLSKTREIADEHNTTEEDREPSVASTLPAVTETIYATSSLRWA